MKGLRLLIIVPVVSIMSGVGMADLNDKFLQWPDYVALPIACIFPLLTIFLLWRE